MLENPQYKQLLAELSVTESDLALKDMNAEDIASAARLVTLDHLDVIDIDGEDAEKFLQGQFSNDVSQLKSGFAQLNTYCNPKGRTLAVFWLLREEDRFTMLIPSALCKPVSTRLKMYVLRSKVNLNINQRFALGITHPNQLANQLDGLSMPENAILHACESLSSLPPRSIVVMGESEVSDLLSNGVSRESIAGSPYWRLLDIQSGIGFIYEENYEEFIPQHINIDLSGGISFTKGCYPGQEIIARLRYLGKLKQRAIYCKIESEQPVTRGQEVFAASKPNSKSGLIIDAVEYPEHCWHVLTNINSNYIDDGQLGLGNVDGPELERMTLPYVITLEKPKGRSQDNPT